MEYKQYNYQAKFLKSKLSLLKKVRVQKRVEFKILVNEVDDFDDEFINQFDFSKINERIREIESKYNELVSYDTEIKIIEDKLIEIYAGEV